MPRNRPSIALLLLASACGGTATSPARGGPASSDAPSYEVHEWGLVRGTLQDRIAISGPHAEPIPMPVAKPVLYFHRRGEGALEVDVEARIPNGRIVEHWPQMGPPSGDVVRWDDVLVQEGSCHGSRYPSFGEPACNGLWDGCESATLAEVETGDSSCLHWPRPPDDDGPTQAWNNLFYRGEVMSAPSLPLQAEVLADGRLRINARGADRVPGHVLRIRRANGAVGVTDALTMVEAPAPGESVVLGPPSAPVSGGANRLGDSLLAAGLTPDEVEAFRRAWDTTLFGPGATGNAAPIVRSDAAPLARPEAVTSTTMPMPPTPTTSILYVLPRNAADALATLTFTPPPTAVRRAIVVWIEEGSAR